MSRPKNPSADAVSRAREVGDRIQYTPLLTLSIFRELYCFRLVRLSVVTLTQSFLVAFLPNFIYELLLSTFRSILNMGFVRYPRWPTKWPLPINVRCRGHSNLVIFIGFLSNFLYGLLLSNSHSSSNIGFVGRTNDKQDGWQNGRRLSVPLLWSL